MLEEKRPAVAVPLTVGGKVTGVLTLAGKPGGQYFTEEESTFLTTLGTVLGLALENARLFRKVQERAAMLERLVEVGQAITGSLDADVVIEKALASLEQLFGAAWCALRLYDEKAGEAVLKAGERLKKGICDEVHLRPEASATCPLIERVVRTKEPVVIADVNAAGLNLPCRSRGAEVRAIAVVPVLAAGKLLGTLAIHSSVPQRWSDEEIGYLMAMATQTGLALENARLYSSLREYYLSTVQALAAALEAKDVYTRGHSIRVARWARSCARILGLGAEKQERVYLAGLLHDLGKIGVSEDILLKPGPLTPEERKEMQAHPEVGARILEPARFPEEVIAAVRHHHEDYGGGGYPAGLSGEEIPLLARIIRVADAYDAMTSARPYRQALTPQKAREELKRWAGQQFDPRVVEAFLRIPPDEMADIATERGGTILSLLCEILLLLSERCDIKNKQFSKEMACCFALLLFCRNCAKIEAKVGPTGSSIRFREGGAAPAWLESGSFLLSPFSRPVGFFENQPTGALAWLFCLSPVGRLLSMGSTIHLLEAANLCLSLRKPSQGFFFLLRHCVKARGAFPEVKSCAS